MPHRPRSVQDHQRQLRPQRRRCAARPGRRAAQVEDPLARHGVAAGRRRVRRAAGELLAGRGGAQRRDRCARRSATTSSSGKSARSGSAPASASCRSRRRTRTSRRCCPPRTAPARPPRRTGRNRIYSFQENDIDLMRRRREMQWAARINNALEDDRFEMFRQIILPLQQPGAARRALRAAAAHARRGGQDRRAGPVHRRGRALRPDAEHRSLDDRARAALAGVRGGRAREARAVLDQSVRARASATTSSCRSSSSSSIAAASTARRSASRSPRPRRSPASRRRTASSTRSRSSAAASRSTTSAPACRRSAI